MDVTDWPMFRRARDGGMGYLPQDCSVFKKLTVEQNLLALLELLGYDRAAESNTVISCWIACGFPRAKESGGEIVGGRASPPGDRALPDWQSADRDVG